MAHFISFTLTIEHILTIVYQLDDLRGLVRSPLTRMQRSVLSALIVIEVHARDVVDEMLQQKVSNSNDFEWISQLRSHDNLSQWDNFILYLANLFSWAGAETCIFNAKHFSRSWKQWMRTESNLNKVS